MRKKCPAGGKSENMTMKPHPKTVQTQATIKKVRNLILKGNSLIQRFIASKLGMSSSFDIDKFELHMDKKSLVTSKSTAAFLAKKESETGIKLIPFHETPAKSPNASSTEFCAFGLLKRALENRLP
ncbi:hypothetical protein TNCV_2134241 [Trichonephila clavipes]|nr:hypothetical protein TNCV_2134241 [Trichonephila clavipes]